MIAKGSTGETVRNDLDEALSNALTDAWNRGYAEGQKDAYRKYSIGRIVDKLGNVAWQTDGPPPNNGEYIVTIEGATDSTTLRYINGEWRDDVSECVYQVKAWAKKPPAYKEDK